MTVVESILLGDLLMGKRLNQDIGVYLVITKERGTIYVGSSKKIGNRIRNYHRQDNSPLWREIIEYLPRSLHWRVRAQEVEGDPDLFAHNARKLETELIREHLPHLNEYMQPEPILR